MDILEFLKEQAKHYKCPNCGQSLAASGIFVVKSVS
jgi:hypothetical protein